MQDPYDHLKNRARNLLSTGISTGISIFNTVASNFNAADDASSGDEERPNVAETDSYVEKGIRGVLVFPTTSQKTGKRKMIHINLYKSQFISYHDGHKRVHSCSDVLSTAKVSELQINMELKGNRRKRIIFDGEGMADKFHMYMEFINEQGRAIRRAFNDIDVNRSGRIVRGDLERAMMKTDLAADNEVIERM